MLPLTDISKERRVEIQRKIAEVMGFEDKDWDFLRMIVVVGNVDGEAGVLVKARDPEEVVEMLEQTLIAFKDHRNSVN